MSEMFIIVGLFNSRSRQGQCIVIGGYVSSNLYIPPPFFYLKKQGQLCCRISHILDFVDCIPMVVQRLGFRRHIMPGCLSLYDVEIDQ